MPGAQAKGALGPRCLQRHGSKATEAARRDTGTLLFGVLVPNVGAETQSRVFSGDARAVGAAQSPQDNPAALSVYPTDGNPCSALFWDSPPPSPAGICNCGAAARGGELGASATSAHPPPLLSGG